MLTPTLFLGEPSETLATTHVVDPIEAAVLIMAGARVILDGDDAWARGAETMLLLGMSADWIRLRIHCGRTAHIHDDVEQIGRCERRYWDLRTDTWPAAALLEGEEGDGYPTAEMTTPGDEDGAEVQLLRRPCPPEAWLLDKPWSVPDPVT